MIYRKPERLVIFDLDGTLCPLNSTEFLPGVLEWCSKNKDVQVAIATNQGGVGLRYWMETEKWGNPSAYPTSVDIFDRLMEVKKCMRDIQCLRLYVCYAYENKQGKVGPVPEGQQGKPIWSITNRKPQPGMLIRAMNDAGALPKHTVMVGDRDDDAMAAQRAGCGFIHADEFFGRA